MKLIFVSLIRINWIDRSHFMSIAITIMRRFLVDHSCKKHAQKRIPKAEMGTLDDVLVTTEALASDIEKFDDALSDLNHLKQSHLCWSTKFRVCCPYLIKTYCITILFTNVLTPVMKSFSVPFKPMIIVPEFPCW